MSFELNAIKSTPDIRDWILEDLFSNNTEDIRRCDYRNELLPVRNQGSQGTCYAQTAACVKEWQENKKNYFSPQYIYDNRDYWNNNKQDGDDFKEDYGMQGRDVMKILKNSGVCDENDYPYGYSRQIKDIPEYIKNIAKKNVIKAFAKINTLDGLRNSLKVNGPCLIAFPVYNYSDQMWLKKENDNFQGGHAMTVVGFDDDKEYFIIRNSWGDKWADNGYTYYKYIDWNSHWECWTTVDCLKNNQILPEPDTESEKDKDLNNPENEEDIISEDSYNDKEEIDDLDENQDTISEDSYDDKEEIDDLDENQDTISEDSYDDKEEIDDLDENKNKDSFCSKLIKSLLG